MCSEECSAADAVKIEEAGPIVLLYYSDETDSMHQFQMTQTSSARRFGWLEQQAAAHCPSLRCPKPLTGRRARPSWDRQVETKQDSAALQVEEPSLGCSVGCSDFQTSLLVLEFLEPVIVEFQLELPISKTQKLLEQQMADCLFPLKASFFLAIRAAFLALSHLEFRIDNHFVRTYLTLPISSNC